MNRSSEGPHAPEGEQDRLQRMTHLLNVATMRLDQLKAENERLRQALSSAEKAQQAQQSRADAAQVACAQAETRAVQAELQVKHLEVRVKHLEETQRWLDALDAEVAKADLLAPWSQKQPDVTEKT